MNIKTNTMNTIKFTNKSTIIITKQGCTPIKYKGYEVGSLLPSFGFIYDADNDKDGVSSWFNHKGLTYVVAPK